MKRKQKSKAKSRFSTFIILVCIGLVAFFAYQNRDKLIAAQDVVIEESNDIAEVIEISPVDKEKQRALDNIMSREEFQRQQALLAEEIYIKEQQDELAQRRAEIIAELDREADALDAQLETVLNDLVSFESAPMPTE